MQKVCISNQVLRLIHIPAFTRSTAEHIAAVRYQNLVLST